MKKNILITIIFCFIITNIYSQQVKTHRQFIEDNLVPKVIRNNFNNKYPGSFVMMWYVTHITYWYEDYASDWYGGWYSKRTTVYYNFGQPGYYEVAFSRNKENCRALYNRYGSWFETRTKIDSLPKEIEKALMETEFVNWIWSQHMEKIEAPGMTGNIYRLHVSNGKISKIIRINQKGEIIQIKYE